VVFESGTGADHYYWKSVLAEVSKHTLACAYDRAGLVRSDPAKTLPRTTQDMVDDLHAILTNASIQGPYVLVGHSMGAYIIRLFTSQYPQDVVGLVFIDSYTPGLTESYCAALPTESTDEDTSFKGARADCQVSLAPVTDWTQVDEGFDDITSQNQVSSTGPYGDLPLVVLAAQYSVSGSTGKAGELHDKMWEQAQRGLADLSTQGQYIVVQNAYHVNILEKQAVWDAIIAMVDALQNK
jgi:pimeloyl-ACP methyl ester carboxylesterase